MIVLLVLGRVSRVDRMERRTHDRVRHGRATLFAALDADTDEVTGRSYARHRHREFIRFLELVVQQYPRGELHAGTGYVSSASRAAL